jgi:hypothetical protein
MKRFLFFQWTPKIICLIALLSSAIGLFSAIQFIFLKPKSSQASFTEFSNISIPNNIDCNNINPFSFFQSKQFPISLEYQNISQTSLNLRSDYGSFDIELKVSNAGGVQVAYYRDLNTDASPTYVFFPKSKDVTLTATTNRLSWESPTNLEDFSSLRFKLSDDAYSNAPNCSNMDFGDCESLLEDYGNSWINTKPAFNYQLGVCGENLAYVSRYHAATLTDLYSMNINVVPQISTIPIGFKFVIDEPEKLTVNGKTISNNGFAVVQIVFYKSSESAGNSYFQTRSESSIQLLTRNYSDSMISFGDAATRVSPGLVFVYEADTEKERVSRLTDNIPTKVSFTSYQLDINLPKELVVANNPSFKLSPDIRQVVFYSNFRPLDIELSNTGWLGDAYEIKGERMGILVNGTEMSPSPWETVRPDLQVALITVIVPIIAAIIAYGINKRHSINEFRGWLFSIPRYTPPVVLNPDAYIFNLFSGKRIAGILDSIEGRSTHRVFILKEVHEWDKDHWDVMLPSEVRIPQNQIEMYYKNTP